MTAVKLPKLPRGARWARVAPPRVDVVRRLGNVYSLYVDGELVGTAQRHPSGIGWKAKPAKGRNRRVPTLPEALELLRRLDREAQWRTVQ